MLWKFIAPTGGVQQAAIARLFSSVAWMCVREPTFEFVP